MYCPGCGKEMKNTTTYGEIYERIESSISYRCKYCQIVVTETDPLIIGNKILSQFVFAIDWDKCPPKKYPATPQRAVKK